jgi:hypothetical protein
MRLSKEEEKAREHILEDETRGIALFRQEDESEKESAVANFFSVLMYRIKEFWHSAIYATQRVFRLHHLADIDLWNFDAAMAKWIYPRLKTFIDQEQFGYPRVFCEYEETEWSSKDEYDDAIRTGAMIGGGKEAWEKVLQEMIFAFEWRLMYSDKEDTQMSAFCKKLNIKNPHEKSLENKTVSYNYECKEPPFSSLRTSEMDLDIKEPEKYVFNGRVVRYYDVKLEIEIEERARKGFAYFGTYFLDLWY